MDQRLREAKRRADESGDPYDIAGYYQELLRAGEITPTRMRWISAFGDYPASLALGLPHSHLTAAQIFEENSERWEQLSPTAAYRKEELRVVLTICCQELAAMCWRNAHNIRDAVKLGVLRASGSLFHALELEQWAHVLDTVGIISVDQYKRAHLRATETFTPAQAQQKQQELNTAIIARLKLRWIRV